MVALDQVGEELQEEGDQQQADVHAIHIGIGRNDHLVITESIQAILDVQSGLQQVELLVLIHNLLGQAIAIQRLTP